MLLAEVVGRLVTGRAAVLTVVTAAPLLEPLAAMRAAPHTKESSPVHALLQDASEQGGINMEVVGKLGARAALAVQADALFDLRLGQRACSVVDLAHPRRAMLTVMSTMK